jgi:hypothetical protein
MAALDVITWMIYMQMKGMMIQILVINVMMVPLKREM